MRAGAYLASWEKFLGPTAQYRYLGPESMFDSAVRGALLLESLITPAEPGV